MNDEAGRWPRGLCYFVIWPVLALLSWAVILTPVYLLLP